MTLAQEWEIRGFFLVLVTADIDNGAMRAVTAVLSLMAFGISFVEDRRARHHSP